ncbi:TrpB-like pyridoxal phosphate-dependent enzyme [Tepidiforma flava]|uniref:TrpB-like pyridoxal phosphate-dependent enzyme n=1 Tax=Tepidiforma flava TaxID=3004094 RepID=UPI00357103A6
MKTHENSGSLGIAISEAVEDAAMRDDTKYSLGSVLNHVLLHQTVIGQEAIAQMEMAGEYPDVVIGLRRRRLQRTAGLIFPFMKDRLAGKTNTRFLAVEPASCPSLTKGEYRYDFGDTAGLTPLLKMYTLGHTFMPPGIHAGGLRYHAMAPLLCHLYDQGYIEARAYPQNPCFEAATLFARTEGIVPAPESSHAIRAAIDEAIQAREEGRSRVILFNLSGHGLLDLQAYDDYLAGKLIDDFYPEEKVREAMKDLPVI